MDMSGMDMATSTASSAMTDKATATSQDMAGMSSATSTATSMSSMDMGGSCKISMMWNWNTIDSCFVSESWHVTSSGMFAGSCIGVILLVIALELLRRASREYDRFILQQYQRDSSPAVEHSPAGTEEAGSSHKRTAAAVTSVLPTRMAVGFKPSLLQQMIRALLHMLQFAVAYLIMLLAMYYNGYIIICIFIGAYLGFFIFGWEKVELESDRNHREPTMCCG